MYEISTDANGHPVRSTFGDTTGTFVYDGNAAVLVTIQASDDSASGSGGSGDGSGGGRTETVKFKTDEYGRTREMSGASWGHVVIDYDTLSRPRRLWGRGLANTTLHYRDSGEYVSINVDDTTTQYDVDEFGRVVCGSRPLF